MAKASTSVNALLRDINANIIAARAELRLLLKDMRRARKASKK